MIRGLYRVYKNGLLVCESPNIITTRGRALILRYLAGNIGTFAGAIAAGTAAVPATVNDTKLGFEATRGPITLGAADVPSSRIVFKASIPQEFYGTIYELGVYPRTRLTDIEMATQLYLGFEPTLESLTGGGVNTTNYRIGAESYGITVAAGGTGTIVAGTAPANFAGSAGTDTFSLAYFLNDANTASIRVRLYVDTANYFTYTITTGTTTGYTVTEWAKSAFVATGTPSWENITSADFVVTARAGGATTVQLDGMRVNDIDVYPDYGLVSRTVLATPLTKARGEQMDIEYAMEFSI